MRRALLSVTDKTGVAEFGRALVERGFELVSTGGTAAALREAGLPVTEVGDVTGFPEALDGRVKTLHPLVHGGLLGDRRQPAHVGRMAELGITPIEVVAVNLYAFEQTARSGADDDAVVEAIDIGGPAMLRAGAKNHANVTVVVDPADYATVIAQIEGQTDIGFRRAMAAKAFRHTAFYDSLIARWMTGGAGDPWTETLTLGWRRSSVARYGENPHQRAAVYVDPFGAQGVPQSHQLWGKELSYNNILDADAAWELVCDLDPGACAIVKHGNPCGAANLADSAAAYRAARATDPVSAFGGIAAFHGPVDETAAGAMTEKGNFLEMVLATSFSPEALAVFRDRSGWGQDVRLLEVPPANGPAGLVARSVRGGVLLQDSDEDPGGDWRVVTDRGPTEDEAAALRLAWRIVAHVKSNAIVITDRDRLLGVGAGQMNRVQSVSLAVAQAGAAAQGAALASDAFFPFDDNVRTAAAAGVHAIVQPGGSKKDPEVIAAANDFGLTMVFTGVRHFRH